MHGSLASAFAWLVNHWLAYLDLGMAVVLGVPAGISLLYLYLGRDRPSLLRVLKSSHVALLVLAWYYAINIGAEPGGGWEAFFFVMIGAAFLSVFYSLWGLAKHWYVHTVHILTASYGLIIMYRGALALDPV